MTPRELFDIALNSKYEAARLVEDIIQTNSPKLLHIFVEEIKEISKMWQYEEDEKKYAEAYDEFLGEINRIEYYSMCYGMPWEDQKQAYADAAKLCPLPGENIPKLPSGVLYVIETLTAAANTDKGEKAGLIEGEQPEPTTTTAVRQPEQGITEPAQQPTENADPEYSLIFTAKGQIYITRAIEAEFIVSEEGRLQWVGTKRDLVVFAEGFSEKLGIKNKWKVFQELFGVKYLAQEKNDMVDSGKTSKYINEINAIFND